MEMTTCVGAGLANNKSMFKNWSTETTRVFDTSAMEMTEAIGQENKLSSELQSALREVVADRTRMFSGEEETAEMEFTACLTNTVNPIQVNLNDQQTLNAADAPTPSPKLEDNLGSNPPLVDSQAFLQKLGFGSQVGVPQMPMTATQNVSKLETFPEVQESPSVKIDAQSFLSKMMQSKPPVTEAAIKKPSPVRDRTFTQGSDEMEFTACLTNTNLQDVQNIGDTQGKRTESLDSALHVVTPYPDTDPDDSVVSFKFKPDATIALPGGEDMEFTTCLTGIQSVGERQNVTASTKTDDSGISFKPNATIMMPQGEDMEFTTCLRGTQAVGETLSVGPSTKGNTTVHFESDTSWQMEFTACVDVPRTVHSKLPVLPTNNTGDAHSIGDRITGSSSHISQEGIESPSREINDQMEFTSCVTSNIMGPKLDALKTMNDPTSLSALNSPDNKRTKLNNHQSLGNKTILFESGSGTISGNMELTMCTGNNSPRISPVHSPVYNVQVQGEPKEVKNPRKRTSWEMRQDLSQAMPEISSNLNVTKYFGGDEKTDAMELTTFHSKILEVRDDNNQEVKLISEEIEPEVPDSLPASPEFEGTAALRYCINSYNTEIYGVCKRLCVL